MAIEKQLYSLISLDDFKAFKGIDDRDDKFAKFCLVTSTLNLEHYCKRHFLRKKYFETIELFGELRVTLNEYPVSEVLAVYANKEIMEPEFYSVIPDCGSNEDYPYSIDLSPAVLRMGCKAIKVVYCAGYLHNKIPSDLSAACYELAAWNFSHYKGNRIGMSGNVRGNGVQGEHFEVSMPENVKAMIEPYRRKTISIWILLKCEYY